MFLLPVVHSRGDEVKTLEIGQQAPDFDLPGVDGNRHQLKEYAGHKVLAVIFTCNHCPTAQAYEDRIIQLHADYKDRGVALVAISPNDDLAVRLDELGYTDVGDSLEDMKIRARDRNFEFPYLYDGETQSVSKAFGVLATPHVFIFDQERKLRYAGRIDDSDIGVVKSHDARNAIDALLADKPVPVATTRVFGCSTKWASKRQSAVESIKRWDAEPVEIKEIGIDEIKTIASNDSDKHLLINVWATWCIPCIDELATFTEINRMYRKRKFEMITICLDQVDAKDQALRFLTEQRLAATNYICNSDDKDQLAEALDKEWPGPVPYTIIIAPGGKVVYRTTEEIDPAKLKKALVDQLGRTYANR